jgi:hypothetical protein
MEHFMHLLASASRGSLDRSPVGGRAGRSGWDAAAGDGVRLARSARGGMMWPGGAGLRGRWGRADGGALGLGRLSWSQECATLVSSGPGRGGGGRLSEPGVRLDAHPLAVGVGPPDRRGQGASGVGAESRIARPIPHAIAPRTRQLCPRARNRANRNRAGDALHRLTRREPRRRPARGRPRASGPLPKPTGRTTMSGAPGVRAGRSGCGRVQGAGGDRGAGERGASGAERAPRRSDARCPGAPAKRWIPNPHKRACGILLDL